MCVKERNREKSEKAKIEIGLETVYACNGVKCILAFLAGSQSPSQLDGSCQVFATQLPSKLIRESWLSSAATTVL